MTSSPRVRFVTGASSGFGRGVTELALSKGDTVVATLRKPEVLQELQNSVPSSQLLVLKLDVTKHDEVVSAFAKARDRFGRIDVVFNNAGYGLLSEVEGTPEEVARGVFETNFWGAAAVMREAIRGFRDENTASQGGRLINMSSVSGLVGLPCLGYYTACKHALEGLTQSLSQELDPSWNIKVSLVEPGTCRTNAVAAAIRVPTHPAYDNGTSGAAQIRQAFASFDDPNRKLGDSQKVVQKIWELSELQDPPLRLILGEDSIKYVNMQLESISKDLREWQADVTE